MTLGQFWSEVRALSDCLPERTYAVNLCENRYLFSVYLLAAALRGQITLLPPSHQWGVIREIMHDYPGAYLVCEQSPDQSGLEWFEAKASGSCTDGLAPDISWAQCSVLAFTSGSSGRPKPCEHSLETFRISAQMAVHSLGFAKQQLLMLSTTPAQHMYGLETSVFWPLFSDLILYDGRPFHAEDIRLAVESAAWPVVLASTPAHLRALLQDAGPWHNLYGIISATDNLSEKLALETQSILGHSPREIYGSTETLSFAWRETLAGNLWTPYAQSRLCAGSDGLISLESPHLPVAIELQDYFSVEADGRFVVLGRQHDMIKIGGKRASLAELNRRLNDIEGVVDGFCFLQQADGAGRLAAVVVSQLDKQQIRSAMQIYVDAVFLPRKVFYVDAVPRNQTGKLVYAELQDFLAGLL